MAGDWIKIRTNLWDDPRVARLCDLTGQLEAAVIGGLYWLWATADSHTETGILHGLTLRAIDRKTGVPGLGEALCQVGWLADQPEGVRILGFEEHNGASAKRRGMEAQRKAAARKQSADCSQDGGNVSASDADKPQTEHGHPAELEKRREEKNTGEGAAKPSQPTPPPDADAPQEPEAIKVKAPRPLRQCPEAFRVTDSLIEWAGANVPGVDLATETAKFRDHTFKVAISDWPGAWRNWMRRAQGFGPPGKAGPSPADRFKGAI